MKFFKSKVGMTQFYVWRLNHFLLLSHLQRYMVNIFSPKVFILTLRTWWVHGRVLKIFLCIHSYLVTEGSFGDRLIRQTVKIWLKCPSYVYYLGATSLHFKVNQTGSSEAKVTSKCLLLTWDVCYFLYYHVWAITGKINLHQLQEKSPYDPLPHTIGKIQIQPNKGLTVISDLWKRRPRHRAVRPHAPL